MSNDSNLASLVAHQISAEYVLIAEGLINYMKSNNLSAMRVMSVSPLLTDVVNRIPGHDLFIRKHAVPIYNTLYLMFRECLVSRLYDIDPVGSTNDTKRDEHLVFCLAGICPTLYPLQEVSDYKHKPESFYTNSLKELIISLREHSLNEAVAKTRESEIVKAVKAAGRSVAMSSPVADTIAESVATKIENDLVVADVQPPYIQSALTRNLERKEADPKKVFLKKDKFPSNFSVKQVIPDSKKQESFSKPLIETKK